jgi:plastocyanin
MKRSRILAAVVLTPLLASGCSSQNHVGTTSLENFKGSGGPAGLGGPSSSAKPSQGAATTQPPPVRTTPADPIRSAHATTAPPAAVPVRTTPPASASHVTLTISIGSDSASAGPFNPPAARIYKGTCASFVNRDVTPRSVVADAGSFTSGTIAPGKSWTYCGKQVGTFNYHDGTRPYAVASLQVLAA